MKENLVFDFHQTILDGMTETKTKMERKIGKKFKLRNSILRETIAEFAGTFILMVILI